MYFNHKSVQCSCKISWSLSSIIFFSAIHPRLQGDYTGHGKTPSRFLFFWPFLTKTKQEWPLPGHIHCKFLLGSLHLGAPYFDLDFPTILGYSHVMLDIFIFIMDIITIFDITIIYGQHHHQHRENFWTGALIIDILVLSQSSLISSLSA